MRYPTVPFISIAHADCDGYTCRRCLCAGSYRALLWTYRNARYWLDIGIQVQHGGLCPLCLVARQAEMGRVLLILPDLRWLHHDAYDTTCITCTVS